MTAPRTRSRSRTLLVRSAVGALALGVLATPTLVAGSGQAATTNPMYRKVTPPNVFYPVTGSRSVKDLASYRAVKHPYTEVMAPCGSSVFATQPGTAVVRPSSRYPGTYNLSVTSGTNGLVTSYAYVAKPAVQDGQVVAAGQPVASVTRWSRTSGCRLRVAVVQGGRAQNPTSWLDAHVGQAPPTSTLFDAPGITVASFNMLGASHTPTSKYPAYTVRTPKALALLKTRGIDVAGLQEFQPSQSQVLLADPTFKSFTGTFSGGKSDTSNSIIWRDSTMEFVSGDLLPIKYFNGRDIKIPVVLLRQRSTGRTAYFMNTHNPASGVFGYGDQSQWRNYDIGVEKAEIVALRATGRPVIMTGDFNDRQAAYCPMTANKLTISPNSLPSNTCVYPKPSSIDWIFGAGQVRFTSYLRDPYTQVQRISDHPIVIAEAHLQN